MSARSTVLADSSTMFRRSLLRIRRYPSMTALLIGMPIVFLLLFVFVFGGTMGAGIAGGGRDAYLEYVTPGLLVMAVAGAAQGTAITVAMDATEGIITRFRTMAIARSSVLTGHVLGSLVQALLCVAGVLGVALLIGYRPQAQPIDWLVIAGLLVLVALALTWLSVGLGLSAKTPESASNTPMLLILLPFVSSGFVPTDKLPSGVRWFAENQPFTPIIETLRGLLAGAPDGRDAALAVGWCALIAVLAAAWSIRLFSRSRTR